jgi:hypothetical protein
MADLFESARGLIARAKRHIGDLDAVIKVITRPNQYTPFTEMDNDGVTQLHKIKLAGSLAETPYMLFDAVNNLRASLDHIAYETAVLGGAREPIKSAKFPVAITKFHWRNQAKGQTDIPKKIRAVFRVFKPYKRGNYTLWAVNELCNTKKHKFLIVPTIGALTLAGGSFRVYGSSASVCDDWDPDKNEIVFLRIGPGSNARYNLKLAPSVILDDVDRALRGQDPVAVLNAMASECERVLVATEAECRRIGLV